MPLRAFRLVLTLVLLLAAKPAASETFLPAEAPNPAAKGELLYVPVYSRILLSAGRSVELAVTVSVRNTDPDHPIFIRRADYYDNDGHLVRSEINGAHRLEPMSSTHFFVKVTDTVGGVGANYVIEWVAAHRDIAEPVVEAVMIGETGTKGLSFVSPARVIRPLP